MSDIVERLRACHGIPASDPECNCAEAADEIERLRALIEYTLPRLSPEHAEYVRRALEGK